MAKPIGEAKLNDAIFHTIGIQMNNRPRPATFLYTGRLSMPTSRLYIILCGIHRKRKKKKTVSKMTKVWSEMRSNLKAGALVVQ